MIHKRSIYASIVITFYSMAPFLCHNLRIVTDRNRNIPFAFWPFLFFLFSHFYTPNIFTSCNMAGHKNRNSSTEILGFGVIVSIITELIKTFFLKVNAHFNDISELDSPCDGV